MSHFLGVRVKITFMHKIQSVTFWNTAIINIQKWNNWLQQNNARQMDKDSDPKQWYESFRGFFFLNSHIHVMYILSILLAKYSEVKISLKPRKTTASCNLYNAFKDITRLESTTSYNKNINQCDLNSDHIGILSVTYKSVNLELCILFLTLTHTSWGYYHCQSSTGATKTDCVSSSCLQNSKYCTYRKDNSTNMENVFIQSWIALFNNNHPAISSLYNDEIRNIFTEYANSTLGSCFAKKSSQGYNRPEDQCYTNYKSLFEETTFQVANPSKHNRNTHVGGVGYLKSSSLSRIWYSHSPENDTIAHDKKLKNESIHTI